MIVFTILKDKEVMALIFYRFQVVLLLLEERCNIFKKERVLEGLRQFEKNKQPVKIKSISIKDSDDEVHLTDISHIPMHDTDGQFQGSIMILDDISEKEEIHAELNKKQEELNELNTKFEKVYSKLQFIEQDRFARDQYMMKVGDDNQKKIDDIKSILDKKKKELETLNSNIISKTSELESINTKILESKSILIDFENKIAQKKFDLNRTSQSEGELSKTFKDKLKIIDEIDKTLGKSEEEPLKTKKLDADNENE